MTPGSVPLAPSRWSPNSAFQLRQPRPLSGLRPSGPPGLFLPRLRLRSSWPLVCPDPTSLSTPIGTNGRRTPNRKSDDNARAKCGTGECRQDQNHDPPPRCEETKNPQMPRALPIDMRCQSDASSLASQIVTSKIYPVRAGMGLVARPPAKSAMRPGLNKGPVRLVCFPVGGAMRRRP